MEEPLTSSPRNLLTAGTFGYLCPNTDSSYGGLFTCCGGLQWHLPGGPGSPLSPFGPIAKCPRKQNTMLHCYEINKQNPNTALVEKVWPGGCMCSHKFWVTHISHKHHWEWKEVTSRITNSSTSGERTVFVSQPSFRSHFNYHFGEREWSFA